jgi:hypothetical protein
MTTENPTSQSDQDKKKRIEARSAEYAGTSDWRPKGWPRNPSRLPFADRPIVGKNLAELARQIDSDRPSYAAQQMLAAAQSIGLSVSQPVLHRFFALERDTRKNKPGVTNKSGHEAKDEWAAKAADYQAVAKAAFCLIHRADKAEGPKWNRFEEQVFEGTSLLPPEREKKTLTNHQIVQGLFDRLQRVVLNTGIDKFWNELADTPFDLSWYTGFEKGDDGLHAPVQTRPHMSDEEVLSLGLGKLVRFDPITEKWRVSDVSPDANLYWSEVSIELGRIAVPKEIWVLKIPQNLREQFTHEAAKTDPLPGSEDEGDAHQETVTSFPSEGQEWLLEVGWGGKVPDSQWDLEEWAKDEASCWTKRTFGFDCRLMLTVSRNTEGSVQTTLEVRPRLEDNGQGLMAAHFVSRDDLIEQLKNSGAGLKFGLHRMGEEFWPEVIHSSWDDSIPEYWAAIELQNSSEDLRTTFVLDQLRLADANEHLNSFAFYPTIAVADSGGSRQFAEGTVLKALFANLALGDCPKRIDRLLETQAKSIRDFGTAHLDELVAESDALLADLDKTIGGQP